MSQSISLRDVERKSFTATFEDGLLDIFLGSLFFMFAVAPFLSPYLGDFWSSFIFLPFWGALFLVLWAIRHYVTGPRMGSVRWGAWRRRRLLRFNVLMVIALCASAALGALSLVRFEAVPGWMHTARFSLVVLIAFSLAAHFIGLNRLYVYGFLGALAPLVGELLYQYAGVSHHGFPMAFGFTFLVVIGTGIVLLIRFLRRHPAPCAAPAAEEAE